MQYFIGVLVGVAAFVLAMLMLARSQRCERDYLTSAVDQRGWSLLKSMAWAVFAWVPVAVAVWCWGHFDASVTMPLPGWAYLVALAAVVTFVLGFVPHLVPTKAAQFFGLMLVLANFAQPWFHRGETYKILWWDTTLPSGAVVAMLLVAAGAIFVLRGGLPAWLALGVVIWQSVDWGPSNWVSILDLLAWVFVDVAIIGLVAYYTTMTYRNRDVFQTMARVATWLLLSLMAIALLVTGLPQVDWTWTGQYNPLVFVANWLLLGGFIVGFAWWIVWRPRFTGVFYAAAFAMLLGILIWIVSQFVHIGPVAAATLWVASLLVLCLVVIGVAVYWFFGAKVAVAILLVPLLVGLLVGGGYWVINTVSSSGDSAALSQVVPGDSSSTTPAASSSDEPTDEPTDESTDNATDNGEEADQAKDKNKPSAATIRALTVSFVDADNTCSVLVRKHGGLVATTDDGEDIVKFDIGALHRVGTGKDLRRWSDALSTPLGGKTNADKLEAVKVAICQDPLYGNAVGNALVNLRVGDVKVWSLNPWSKSLRDDTKINDRAMWYLPLAGIENPKDAQVAKALRRNQAWQDTAARLNTLLDRFQVTKVRSLTSVRNWHLVAGGLVAGSLPEVGLNPQQESLPALVLTVTQKGACAPLAVIGFNVGDKRPEVFPTPSCVKPPKPNQPGTPTTTPPSNPPTTHPCVKPPKPGDGNYVYNPTTCTWSKPPQGYNQQQQSPSNQGGGGHGQAGSTPGAPDQPSSGPSGSGGAPAPTNPSEDSGQGGDNDTPIPTPGG